MLTHPPLKITLFENIPLDIVYEDDTLLLINKKPGMVVHRTWKLGTLVHALAYHFDNLPNSSERPGLVHRIDKDTSGLLDC
jgi:23S rRNA pseudouridine1911/1915/1917 synthase